MACEGPSGPGGWNMRHRFHSLCPYFAMFPESFAEKWIKELSKPDEIVLDPFCGRGTTPFCAIQMGRRAVACDVNDVAICLTRAKTAPPLLANLRRRISRLRSGFDDKKWRSAAASQPEFFHYAFAPATLRRILYLKASLHWQRSNLDAMVASLVLGSLHGESNTSKSYFSNQMPRTISTKPAYSIRYWQARDLFPPERDVFEILYQRAGFRYETPPPVGKAMVLQTDMRQLPSRLSRLRKPISCVVTSPPYFDTTNFEEDQWLRLWFLGGPPKPTTGRQSRDDRHGHFGRYWQFIADMWRMLGALVQPKGRVLVRLGSPRIEPMMLARGLTGSAACAGRRVDLEFSEVSELRRRQTDSFRPGSSGCLVEVDCLFRFKN